MILKAFGISVSKICNYSLYYFFFHNCGKKAFILKHTYTSLQMGMIMVMDFTSTTLLLNNKVLGCSL